MGLEPTTFGTTIRRSNRLSYIHRFGLQNKPKFSYLAKSKSKNLKSNKKLYLCGSKKNELTYNLSIKDLLLIGIIFLVLRLY